MKLKILFLSAIIAIFSFNLSAQSDARLSRELVGLWQSSPIVASGMDDLYRFFADGRFIFENNQMVWSERKISSAGKWRIKNRRLILTFTKETVIIGGKKVKSDPASGSADGYEIAGGKTVTRKLKAPKTEIYQLNFKQGDLTKYTFIGKSKYWQLSIEPNSHPILCLGNPF